MVVDLNFTPQRIKALRERMGLNQTDFAKEVGVDQSTLSLWESGGRSPVGQRVLQRLFELDAEPAGA